jgi:hypothetical protein
MLDQLFKLVKQFGQDTVVNNPEVPNENNNDVMADATSTIANGFQNILSGGGLQNILDLFKGGATNKGGIGGLLKNPIVTMMVGYFISKLVNKYRMSPASASNVANSLIPNVLDSLINRTASTNPSDNAYDLNDLIGSLTGGSVPAGNSGGGFNFQNLLQQLIGGGSNGFNIQDIIGSVTQGAQQSQAQKEGGKGGGIMDMIKGLMTN